MNFLSLNEALEGAKNRQGHRWREKLLKCLEKDFLLSVDNIDEFSLGISFIHGASLLHDDIIDDGPLRGLPEVYATENHCGKKKAVLLGDKMLLGALSILTPLHEDFFSFLMDGVLGPMIEGQWMEGSLDETNTLEDYGFLVKQKTGSLFRFCAQGFFCLYEKSLSMAPGAFYHDYEKKDTARGKDFLESFFLHLGVLYQYNNDLEDYRKKKYEDWTQKLWTFPVFLAHNLNISPPWIQPEQWALQEEKIIQHGQKFIEKVFRAQWQALEELWKKGDFSVFFPHWTKNFCLEKPILPNLRICCENMLNIKP